MLRHEAYIDPVNYVLNNDHVTFMGMSETEAWFSISPSIDVYDASKLPFAFLSQYLNSERNALWKDKS